MITVKVFGQLTDITNSTTIEINDCSSLAEAREVLYSIYPDLMSKKFNIALGNKLAKDDQAIINGEVLSLLPPYSGG
jgi:molybdopterin converting factor small subunit